MKNRVFSVVAIIFLMASSLIINAQIRRGEMPIKMANDVHSFSNPQQVKVTHIDLDWNILFDKKIIQGSVILSFERPPDAVNAPLILDTQDLNIEKTEVSADGKTFTPTTFELGTTDKNLGTPLSVKLTENAKFVRVFYSTNPTAGGLQWLSPEQTAGKKSPYMFSQAQSIFARTFIPLQDSPQIRITYTARVRTPKNLLAVMSSETNPQNSPRTGDYRFKMTKPIPSYLIAIAVGDIAFQSLGKRTGVYTEPSMLKKTAWELADTEKMVIATEKVFGKYRWGRYDLLVLPPSFPFGGMENPCLTFATPTIIAGDRSLVSLVAHELAHSWSGNLVTNATWRDFWLNEGFTTYLERRIIEAVYGVNRREMEAVLGKGELLEEMSGLEKPDQILHVNLDGRHPDDGFTLVPYEKGALFLRYLEEKYGRAKFDKFVKGYFDSHAFQSITTDTFVEYLKENLLDKEITLEVSKSSKYNNLITEREKFKKYVEGKLEIKGDKDGSKFGMYQALLNEVNQKIANLKNKSISEVEIDEWIEQAGLPKTAPNPTSINFAKVDDQVKNYEVGKPLAIGRMQKFWTTQEWLRFLKELPENLGSEKMSGLDKLFNFTKSGNSEISFQWLLMAIKNKYSAADSRLEEFLINIGRRKFVRPLYAELAKTSEGKQRAKDIYAKARSGYHPITQGSIDEILK